MKKLLPLIFLPALASMIGLLQASAAAPKMSASGIAFPDEQGYGAGVDDFGRPYIVIEGDTMHATYLPGVLPEKTRRLDNSDYIRVAEELGVEPAAIKAVVSIEAGTTQRGFYAEGKPVINFDLSVFRQMAARRGVNLGKYSRSHALVFNRPNTARYGSYQKAQQARLDMAMEIDSIAAINGTFWGMFQIGGFNWKRCGADSPADFVRRMSLSEQEQLEMFAEFIRNSGLLEALRSKNWSSFAKGYNGPSYASRGYHTRLANAYAKFKKDFT
ncbi:MAG: N-acetylmuramidase family protein [Muribaculaceae bacterium]|nr:N-acetylmuramidase family protein [Muribaculaceae bacterium]